MLRVFENREMWRIFVPKRDAVIGDWKTLHNEKLNYLYCSPNSIPINKSRRMRWVEHVARMRRGEMHTGLWRKT
jgi:hypothetical protein